MFLEACRSRGRNVFLYDEAKTVQESPYTHKNKEYDGDLKRARDIHKHLAFTEAMVTDCWNKVLENTGMDSHLAIKDKHKRDWVSTTTRRWRNFCYTTTAPRGKS